MASFPVTFVDINCVDVAFSTALQAIQRSAGENIRPQPPGIAACERSDSRIGHRYSERSRGEERRFVLKNARTLVEELNCSVVEH